MLNLYYEIITVVEFLETCPYLLEHRSDHLQRHHLMPQSLTRSMLVMMVKHQISTVNSIRELNHTSMMRQLALHSTQMAVDLVSRPNLQMHHHQMHWFRFQTHRHLCQNRQCRSLYLSSLLPDVLMYQMQCRQWSKLLPVFVMLFQMHQSFVTDYQIQILFLRVLHQNLDQLVKSQMYQQQ